MIGNVNLDGFNLYYRALMDTPPRAGSTSRAYWLNLPFPPPRRAPFRGLYGRGFESPQARLPDIEYQLQAELSANADLILTYEQLLRRVWGHDSSGDSGPVRAIVRRLRRRLGAAADPTYIFNKRRIGYWMEKGETREQ